MDNKLKPCPFCGSSNFYFAGLEFDRKVGCANCGATTRYYPSEEAAIEAWNARTQPTFTFRELFAIYEVFTAPNPSRFLTDGYHSIVEKCELALKGGSNEKH